MQDYETMAVEDSAWNIKPGTPTEVGYAVAGDGAQVVAASRMTDASVSWQLPPVRATTSELMLIVGPELVVWFTDGEQPSAVIDTAGAAEALTWMSECAQRSRRTD